MKRYCYIAMQEGAPGAYAMCADLPELAKDTADFVMEELRNGATLRRIPVDDARGLLGKWLAWKEQQKAA